MQVCTTCVPLIADVVACFGYVQKLVGCVWECIPCNIGLIPDGIGGCRAAGRRADSVAYEDDQGRVFDVNSTLLWYTHQTSDVSIEHRRVLRVFSYGDRWTCGIEQIYDYLHVSQDTHHLLTDTQFMGVPRRTVSVDCRYDTICALYYNFHNSTQPDATEYTPDIIPKGSSVQCLGDDEWQLPWEATNIVSGVDHACALLSDAHSSVLCWGSSTWGNAQNTP